uniref:Uncharacterized protein n=1 Tax=Panthera leo TaxID=9689 RepID=A0A8C8XT09_PANLE
VRIISVISIYVAENVDLLLESIQYCRRYVGEPRIYFGILLPHAASCIINPTVWLADFLLPAQQAPAHCPKIGTSH